MAAQQEVTRNHLALWDSSARAWLQTADEAYRFQQTQLRLVVDNVNIPINKDKDLYQSVVKAWIDAMTSVESLITGMPQRVQDGAVLLGLLSWHLYPDMVVLGSTTKNIEQKDDLIGAGGILTIGLQHRDRENNSGVFWSLPLAYMRYYGTTPIASQTLALDTSRISVDQLYQVVLGSLSAHWKSNVHNVVDFILALHHAVQNNVLAVGEEKIFNSEGHIYPCLEPRCWFMALVQAAKLFVCSRDSEKQVLLQLAAFGERRAKLFLCNSQAELKRGFGLTDFHVLFSLLRNHEQRVKILRHCAKRYQVGENDLIIRYQPLNICYPRLDSFGNKSNPRYYEYASAIARTRKSRKRAHDGTEQDSCTRHR
jgi:hypothetical protein